LEKVPGNPNHFHIYNVDPSDISKKFNLIFTANRSEERLMWIVQSNTEEGIIEEQNFKQAIARAIFNKCLEMGISVYD
jgi:single-stranded DNA-specific DHH superfamily exonuclease